VGFGGVLRELWLFMQKLEKKIEKSKKKKNVILKKKMEKLGLDIE
jgi:hypothetical protein